MEMWHARKMNDIGELGIIQAETQAERFLTGYLRNSSVCEEALKIYWMVNNIKYVARRQHTALQTIAS